MLKDFLLAKPLIYKLFKQIISSKKHRNNLIKKFGIKPGDKILDIGCGTGDILEYLPENIDYTGFDINKKYIDAAQKQFKNRGKFFCEEVRSDLTELGSFNIVLAKGILHHLTDEQTISLFKLAKNSLIKGGRFITFDGCFAGNQSLLVRFILNMDRGKFVRNEEEYVKLAKYHFSNVQTEITHNLINIPYTHIIMEGIKD
ncbi:MAG: hypothetical protein A2Y25_04325 [Candidatus Melainabacteria bacterium GWF2_37_15]|nr:MAG: hypothetical protein A2Y25_04325 [Candidatus Melainabacteria bacterium GWF2_37_15]